MIKDPVYFRNFEKAFIADDKISYGKAIKMLESMWEEGLALGILPFKNPLEGIETDIRIAKVLNSCSGN